ncbi:hypothetical protein SO802_024448 [Lithocarpus litseifolius]|uniref:Uncharacterized protein n=1 Tax=Lithocarpus litseifolius TaxID=425828 RepID=A0AAW2C8X7_9ROSI
MIHSLNYSTIRKKEKASEREREDDEYVNGFPKVILCEVRGCSTEVFRVRVSFVKDVQKQEARWERQHELAAENFGFYRLYSVLLVEAIGLAW